MRTAIAKIRTVRKQAHDSSPKGVAHGGERLRQGRAHPDLDSLLLPRTDEPGFWDYGRAVAFRLARFYEHVDAASRSAGRRGR